jgi:1-deoxy-D-xylulose-5-phosphate reductoisomerase
VAVDAFLARRIRFTDIALTVGAVLDALPNRRADSIDDVLEADGAARRAALEFIASRLSARGEGGAVQ